MNPTSRVLFRCLGACALLLGLAACASISVQRDTRHAVSQPPLKIYVADFSTAHGEFNVDREKLQLRDFKKDLQKVLQAAQVADLSHRLIPAAPAPKDPWAHRRRAWLICGKFVKVNQGSRFLRAAIGFGAGGTKMLTKIYVYDLSVPYSRPFLTFSTTGGSNAEPGAITSFATDPLDLAIQIALSGVSGFSHGVTEDAKRTAREITAELSDYMYHRHWIPKDAWIKPKHVDKDAADPY